MAFLSSMDISGSALTAERVRMDVISENIANASTTRTQQGGPYRRKVVVLEQNSGQDSFRQMLEDNMKSEGQNPAGVRVSKIEEDPSDFNMVYDPSSPEADENGYVKMPNVDQTKETLDMMSSTMSYNANLTAFNAIKTMASKALELGR